MFRPCSPFCWRTRRGRRDPPAASEHGMRPMLKYPQGQLHDYVITPASNPNSNGNEIYDGYLAPSSPARRQHVTLRRFWPLAGSLSVTRCRLAWPNTAAATLRRFWLLTDSLSVTRCRLAGPNRAAARHTFNRSPKYTPYDSGTIIIRF